MDMEILKKKVSGYRTPKGMAGIMGRAKKLKREGHFPIEEFKEIKVEEFPSTLGSLQAGPCQDIEIAWDNGKLGCPVFRRRRS